jgi:hypothetical protein
MSNFINILRNLVSSAGSLLLIVILSYSAIKKGKISGIIIGLLGGCIGIYLISNPKELYTIGKELTNFGKAIFLEG